MRDLEELVERLEHGDLPLEESLAAFERELSEPPRKITALLDFKHSAPASAVTLGRLS